MTSRHHHPVRAARPYFIGATVLGNTPVFNRSELADKVLELWRAAQNSGRLTLYAYVLLEDRLLAVAAAEELPKFLAQFKAHAAEQILAALDTPPLHDLLRRIRRFQDKQQTEPAAQLWQPGGEMEAVFTAEKMRAKVEFIHTYPVNRGYVIDPTLYRYSSARDYAGQPGLIEVNKNW
jgi:hypothetical protein